MRNILTVIVFFNQNQSIFLVIAYVSLIYLLENIDVKHALHLAYEQIDASSVLWNVDWDFVD